MVAWPICARASRWPGTGSSRVIGHGSMGSVYSALDVGLDRRVAIKVLLPELARDERFRERFLRESRLAASLEHPHIVPIHAAGESDGLLYLVMRYVDGRDLSALLKRLGRLDAERALAILGQVADALDAAHAQGLIHRDVKPAQHPARARGDRTRARLPVRLRPGQARLDGLEPDRRRARSSARSTTWRPSRSRAAPVDGRVDVYAPGLRALRVPDRRAAVRARQRAGVAARAPQRAAAAAHRAAARAARGDGRRDRARAGQGPRPALRDLPASWSRRRRSRSRAATPEVPAPVKAAATLRTFLFADIRGYTSYTREHGDEAGAALAQSFAALVGRAGPRARRPPPGAARRRGAGRLRLRAPGAALRASSSSAGWPRRLCRAAWASASTPARPCRWRTATAAARSTAPRACARWPRPARCSPPRPSRDLAGKAEGVAYGLRRQERLKGFERPVRVVEVHPGDGGPGRRVAPAGAARAGGTRPRLRLGACAAIAAPPRSWLVALRRRRGRRAELQEGRRRAARRRHAEAGRPPSTARSPTATSRIAKGQLWTIDHATRVAARINPRTRKVIDRIPLTGISPGAVAWPPDRCGSAMTSRATVARYDPQYGTLTTKIRLPDKDLGLQGPHQQPGVRRRIAVGLLRQVPVPGRAHRPGDQPGRQDDPLPGTRTARRWWPSATARCGSSPRTPARSGGSTRAPNSIVARAKLHGGCRPRRRWWSAATCGSPVEDDGAVWKVDANAHVSRTSRRGRPPFDAQRRRAAIVYVTNAERRRRSPGSTRGPMPSAPSASGTGPRRRRSRAAWCGSRSRRAPPTRGRV